MADVAGAGRDQRGAGVDSDSAHRLSSFNPSMRAPGDGGNTKPKGKVDNRSAVHHADSTQALLGGGAVPEHDYKGDNGGYKGSEGHGERPVPTD